MRLRRWKGRTKVLQTTSRYSAVAIALHWVIALLIVANIALGLGHELFGRANELAIMAAHKSIGLTISQALQPVNFVLKLLQLFRLGPLERNATRHGVAHCSGNRQAGRRSGRRIARPAESVGFAPHQPPLGQIRQFQIVKKEVQKLLTRQNEPEFILSFARACLATSALTAARRTGNLVAFRSEEHTSELQSLMRISYAVFCLKKKKHCT